MQPSARLQLSFFGTPQIRIDNNLINIERHHAVALLAYLAAEHKTVSRDRVVLLLWPDYGKSQGRTVLRQTLYTINKNLGKEWLATDRDMIELCQVGDLWVDVWHVEKSLSSCKSHGHSKEDKCTECRDVLIEATSRLREEFLGGFSLRNSANFEEWDIEQKAYFNRLYVSSLRDLIRFLSAEGDYTRAIAYSRDWLALDRLHETAHHWLMQLYLSAGDRTAALHQYQECAEVLRSEIGAEPLAETTQLYSEIKAGKIPSGNVGLVVFNKARRKLKRTGGKNRVPTPASSRGASTGVEVLAKSRNRTEGKHALPVQATPFIGREKEVDEAVDLLSLGEVRLLTLTGPAGTGKTRLGVQIAETVAEKFEDGAKYVALDSVTDPGLVPGAVGRVFGLQEGGETPIAEILKGYIEEKELLIVLDNFEQVVEAAVWVADLLAACRRVKILVTSRESLHLRGERIYSVLPMSLPESANEVKPGSELSASLIRCEAVRLFADRAMAVQPNFEITSENGSAVAEICRRLDGLPLAIELAVARIRLLPPEKLLDRLDKVLPILTHGSKDQPSRQRTMGKAIAWSYDLLEDEEKRLFARLSVFSGGFTIEAVEAVCTAGEIEGDVLDGMTSLEEKSLIGRKGAGINMRLFMLETIKEFAAERLADFGDSEAMKRSHAEFFYAVAENSRGNLNVALNPAWSLKHKI